MNLNLERSMLGHRLLRPFVCPPQTEVYERQIPTANLPRHRALRWQTTLPVERATRDYQGFWRATSEANSWLRNVAGLRLDHGICCVRINHGLFVLRFTGKADAFGAFRLCEGILTLTGIGYGELARAFRLKRSPVTLEAIHEILGFQGIFFG